MPYSLDEDFETTSSVEILDEPTNLNSSMISVSSHSSFKKYKECTICLSEFVEGEPVKVVPGCEHVFHERCLNDWTTLRFRCPNCNIEIRVEEDPALKEAYRQTIDSLYQPRARQ